MTTQTAYSTDNPEHVVAYRTAVAQAEHARKRLAADMIALNVGTTCNLVGGPLTDGERFKITALEPNSDGHIPDGWRLNSDSMLVPRRGRPGESARQWLADHTVTNPIAVLRSTGLARAAWIPGGNFGYRVVPPVVFEHDNTLWALYKGKPGESGSGFDNGDTCTWTPRKLSEYYTAKEAHDAAGTPS